MLELLGTFVAGLGWGYFICWSGQRRKSRPMRLVKLSSIVTSQPAIDGVIREEWKLRVQAFTLYTEWSGLSELAAVNAGICSSRGYRRFVSVLKEAGILVAYERSRTHYAPGWCAAKVRSFLRRGKLSLPYPYQPPPIIHSPGQSGRRFYS